MYFVYSQQFKVMYCGYCLGTTVHVFRVSEVHKPQYCEYIKYLKKSILAPEWLQNEDTRTIRRGEGSTYYTYTSTSY